MHFTRVFLIYFRLFLDVYFYEICNYLLQAEVNSLAFTDTCGFNDNISAYLEEILSAKPKFNCLARAATIYRH